MKITTSTSTNNNNNHHSTTSSRVRTSFDAELELPKLHKWFAENPHPSRLTLQLYVKELNNLASRQSRKLLEVHNLCYWFKNARAAYKRTELRMKKSNSNLNGLDHNFNYHQFMCGSFNYQRATNQQLIRNMQNNNNNNNINGSKVKPQSTMSIINEQPTHYRKEQQQQQQIGINTKIRNNNNNNLIDTQTVAGTRLLRQTNSMNNTNDDEPGHNDNDYNYNHNYNCNPKVTAKKSSPPVSSPSSTPPFSCCSSLDTSATLKGSSSSIPRYSGSVATPMTGFNNLDLAGAINSILNSASNFRAAAAAAAFAAATASSSLPRQQQPSGQTATTIASPAVVAAPFQNHANNTSSIQTTALNNHHQQQVSSSISRDDFNSTRTLDSRASLVAAAAALANQAALSLVDEPMRQLFTAFNPTNYQFALGMLDNKMLDCNVLNTMAFPTSAYPTAPSTTSNNQPNLEPKLNIANPNESAGPIGNVAPLLGLLSPAVLSALATAAASVSSQHSATHSISNELLTSLTSEAGVMANNNNNDRQRENPTFLDHYFLEDGDQQQIESSPTRSS